MTRTFYVPWTLILARVIDHGAMHEWLRLNCGLCYGTCAAGVWFESDAVARRFRERFGLDKLTVSQPNVTS